MSSIGSSQQKGPGFHTMVRWATLVQCGLHIPCNMYLRMLLKMFLCALNSLKGSEHKVNHHMYSRAEKVKSRDSNPGLSLSLY